MSQQWFIYYRIRADDLEPVSQAVRAIHARLSVRWPLLRCDLLQKHPSDTEQLTLMETYQFDSQRDACPPASPTLLTVIAQEAESLRPWLCGQRHVEEFVPCV